MFIINIYRCTMLMIACDGDSSNTAVATDENNNTTTHIHLSFPYSSFLHPFPPHTRTHVLTCTPLSSSSSPSPLFPPSLPSNHN